jgi:bifunctional non-homologous end joining protein LigD
MKMPCYVKSSGSRGLHVYVPIRRGPDQKQAWKFAKDPAKRLAGAHPELITGEYRVANRAEGRVLVDYNQNVWGRTLVSVHSVRPKPHAPVSMPVDWREVGRGFRPEDFRIDHVPDRLRKVGDCWKPLTQAGGSIWNACYDHSSHGSDLGHGVA